MTVTKPRILYQRKLPAPPAAGSRSEPEPLGLFRAAEFFTAATTPENLPHHDGREVAFAGRSNSGKSSALNALSQRRKLAFTSRTPGRTQQINFFRLSDGCFVVDLPGYGYAKVPDDVRRQWDRVLPHYLQTREALCGLVIVMDARHPMTPLDRRMLGWFMPTGKPVHILLTKADKLSRQQASATLVAVRRELGRHYPGATVQLFSSPGQVGVAEAEAVLAGWLRLDERNKKPPVKGE